MNKCLSKDLCDGFICFIYLLKKLPYRVKLNKNNQKNKI